MVNIREHQKVQVDDYRYVAARSPGGKKVHIEYLTTTTGNITPGMPVIRGMGAKGEATATETAANDMLAYGISELDLKQISKCTETYGSGDLIPVIVFEGNDGLVCRNILLKNPAAAQPADVPFEAGAAGFQKLSATGTSNIRIYMRNEYHFADPSADKRIVARISLGIHRPALT